MTHSKEEAIFSRAIPPEKAHYQDEHFDVILRPIEMDDAQVLLTAYRESIPMLQRFMDATQYPLTYEAFVSKIKKVKADYLLGSEYQLALFDRKTEELYSIVVVLPGSRVNIASMELRAWTPMKFNRKGYATLASQIVLSIAFICLDSERAQVVCNKENKAAIGLAKKCSLQLEGEHPNYYPVVTPEMRVLGVPNERNALTFGITPEMFAKAPWASKIADGTTLFSLFGDKVLLKEIWDHSPLNPKRIV